MNPRTLPEWSRLVRERDGKCQHCGSLEDLHAHHKLPKSTHPELKLSVSNGMTLCYRCHKKEHEKHRPVRLRSNRPQRKVLEKKIEELEKKVALLEERLAKAVVEKTEWISPAGVVYKTNLR